METKTIKRMLTGANLVFTFDFSKVLTSFFIASLFISMLSILAVSFLTSVIFLIFTVSERMDFEDGAIYVIKAVMGLVIYFYSVNILKNATILSPQNRFVKVLYMLMTIDFLEKFAPWAKKYINE